MLILYPETLMAAKEILFYTHKLYDLYSKGVDLVMVLNRDGLSWI